MPDGLQQRCKECCKKYREDNKIKNQSLVLDIESLRCNKCERVLDISCFGPKLNTPRGFDYWCKDCRNDYNKEYYNDNLDEMRAYDRERIAGRVKWIQDLKSNIPCHDCGNIYEPYCMDYDHVPGNGEKVKAVSRLVRNNAPKEVILSEISKCDLVCCLCHNKRTYDRFNDRLGEGRKYNPRVLRSIQIINEFKARSCVICRIQYESFNMQIDHIDPATKLYDVCDLKGYKEEVLLAELAKCQVLCALCHRRKSIIEQKENKYNLVRPEKVKEKKTGRYV
jgi:hypothetical protein